MPTYLELAALINERCQRDGIRPHVCELGVASGDSLDMWADLFPSVNLVGVDNNPNAGFRTFAARIVAEQDNAGLPDLIQLYGPRWDLIVDDASHRGEPTRAALLNLWPIVRPGGYYVIEDWTHGGTTLLELAHELISVMSESYRAAYGPLYRCESITYRPGLIILHNAG